MSQSQLPSLFRGSRKEKALALLFWTVCIIQTPVALLLVPLFILGSAAKCCISYLPAPKAHKLWQEERRKEAVKLATQGSL